MKTPISVLSVLFVASSFAWADETGSGAHRGSKPLRPPEKEPMNPEALFKRLDRNHDKALNFREFKALPEFKGNADKAGQVFKELDLNDDGLLRFDEFRRHFSPIPPHKGPGPKERFKQLDQDGNGMLSLEEFTAGRDDKNAARLFEKLDQNGDGQLSFDEFRRQFGPIPPDKGPSPEALFKKLDQDGSGTLSLEEFTAGRNGDKAARIFEELDQDGDGQLSLDEFRKQFGPKPPGMGPSPEALFKKLDRDDSGTLSLEEFKDSPRAREHPDQAERLFSELDSDSDALLTLDEFRKLFHRKAPDHRPEEQPAQPAGESLIE